MSKIVIVADSQEAAGEVQTSRTASRRSRDPPSVTRKTFMLDVDTQELEVVGNASNFVTKPAHCKKPCLK